MTGQMRHPDPGQDQEASVIGQQEQMAPALLGIPADPRVSPAGLPGGGTEQQTSQRPARTVPHQVLQVLADAIAMPQIVIALEQKLEQRR